MESNERGEIALILLAFCCCVFIFMASVFVTATIQKHTNAINNIFLCWKARGSSGKILRQIRGFSCISQRGEVIAAAYGGYSCVDTAASPSSPFSSLCRQLHSGLLLLLTMMMVMLLPTIWATIASSSTNFHSTSSSLVFSKRNRARENFLKLRVIPAYNINHAVLRFASLSLSVSVPNFLLFFFCSFLSFRCVCFPRLFHCHIFWTRLFSDVCRLYWRYMWHFLVCSSFYILFGWFSLYIFFCRDFRLALWYGEAQKTDDFHCICVHGNGGSRQHSVTTKRIRIWCSYE